MTTSIPNRAFFGLSYGAAGDIWMNAGGNLGSLILAEIFDSREEAQAFLDGRKLRRGFRSEIRVEPILSDTIRALAAEAARYAALPPLPARDDRKEWADRAAYLTDLLPTVH